MNEMIFKKNYKGTKIVQILLKNADKTSAIKPKFVKMSKIILSSQKS